MAMGDVIGRLSVVLGLDTAAFESGARRASKTTTETGNRMEQLGARVGTAAKALVGLGAAIAGSQLVGQMKDMALAGLEHAAALGEQAVQLGVTTSELQRYRFIATQVGIDQDVMDKGLAKLSITLGDLANGAKLPTAALERLGFSQQRIAEISQMTAGEAIPALAEGFKTLKNPTEAASIAADLFGAKMGGKFLTLMMGGRAALDELTAAYNRLGIELTAGQIAKADKALDDYAALLEVFKARQAQIATDNADGVLAGLSAWEEFKTKLLVIFGEVADGSDRLQTKIDEWDAVIPDPYEFMVKGMEINRLSIERDLVAMGKAWDGAAAHITKTLGYLATEGTAWLKGLYEGARTYLTDKMNKVWTDLQARIEQAKKLFFGLYDAVVGNSYIPDMVDGIAHHMGRLDDVMVRPVKSATEEAKRLFEKFQNEVQGLMENLFPEARELADFRKELGLLDRAIATGGKGTGFSVDQLQAGRGRLISGASPDLLRNVPLPMADQLARFGQVDLGNTSGIEAALKGLVTAANDNADKVGIANVRIAKSFADMAQDTLTALDRMAGAIKGGGFLDILSSVIGLGLQLGSIGLFGKGIQTNINASSKLPGFATGTSFAPGGLALVGERGPELVNLPRGSQVIPNHKLNGGGGGVTRIEVVASEYFDVRVQENISQAAPGIAAAGARGGEARVFHRQSRRVA